MTVCLMKLLESGEVFLPYSQFILLVGGFFKDKPRSQEPLPAFCFQPAGTLKAALIINPAIEFVVAPGLNRDFEMAVPPMKLQ